MHSVHTYPSPFLIMASLKSLEREKQQVVYPAYDCVHFLSMAIDDPSVWKKRKEDRKKVERAYKELGKMLRDPKSVKVIAAWFGEESTASPLIEWMKEVREQAKKLILGS